MLLITINDRPLPLPSGTAFKFTINNPLFSESGSYSYALTLPLALPLVAELWPTLRHPYPSHALPPTPHRFRLVFSDDGQTHEVEGIVKVLGVEDDAVKVQLVSGRGAFTYALSLVPDLSQCTALGAVWQFPLTPDAPQQPDGYTLAHHQAAMHALYAPTDEFYSALGANPGLVLSRPRAQTSLTTNAPAVERALAYAFHADQLPHADLDAYDQHAATPHVRAVAFPTYALTSENKSVQLNLMRHSLGTISVPGFDDQAPTYETEALPFSRAFPYQNLVPQPSLFDLLLQLFRIVGLSFDMDSTAAAFAAAGQSDYWHQIRSYYIANVRPTLTLCHMLPQWSALELVTEFERLFDLQFRLRGLRLSLAPPPAAAASQRVDLQRVHRHASSYRDAADPDDASPLRPSSLSYDWATPNPFLTLTADLIERCHVQPYYGSSVSGSIPKDEEKRRLQERRTLYTDDAGRRLFAYLPAPHLDGRYVLTLIDHFPPRSAAWLSRAKSTRLRLVPAPLHTDGFTLAVPEAITLPDNTWDIAQSVSQHAAPTEVAPPSRLYLFYHEAESRHREIRGVGGKELSTPLPVALPLHQNAQGAWLSVPALVGKTDSAYMAGNMQDPDNPSRPDAAKFLPSGRVHYEFMRSYRPGEFAQKGYAAHYAARPWYFVNLCRVFDLSRLSANAAAFRQPLPSVLSGLSREFRFSDPVSHVSGVFHAFGRLYACSKLELTLTPRGVSPERVGTFHELQS